jgi:hypothetical protein
VMPRAVSGGTSSPRCGRHIRYSRSRPVLVASAAWSQCHLEPVRPGQKYETQASEYVAAMPFGHRAWTIG